MLKKVARAVCMLPNSKGPNVHVIAADSAYELVYWTRRRGAFNAENVNDWILEMLEHLPQGVNPDNVVIVCDNAPCHSGFEQCITTHPGLKILRISPHVSHAQPGRSPLE